LFVLVLAICASIHLWHHQSPA